MFFKLRDYASSKFDSMSLHCVFLSYNNKFKDYMCLHPPIWSVYITIHVLFGEECFPFSGKYKPLQPAPRSPMLEALKLGISLSPEKIMQLLLKSCLCKKWLIRLHQNIPSNLSSIKFFDLYFPHENNRLKSRKHMHYSLLYKRKNVIERNGWNTRYY